MRQVRFFSAFALLLLLFSLLMGLFAATAFLYPEEMRDFLPFQQMRPMHVSASLFWIISGAVSLILIFSSEGRKPLMGFAWPWVLTIVAIFIFYAFKRFGGREYWEFPPFLAFPLLLSWLLLMHGYFRGRTRNISSWKLYEVMWATGLIFFLITFVEQNLWQIPWFRASFIRDITVQWKSNGAMVGAWNQMIYGSSFFLMYKISGNGETMESKKAWFFYFLGLVNLMFNWGHHIYNVPAASWIRHVSYAISMSEWLIFLSIMRRFRSKLEEVKKHRSIMSYRFLSAAEFWVFANLMLALLMSIPAINRYTHGTHITVAHAMGCTIGINTMILLGGFSFVTKTGKTDQKGMQRAFLAAQLSLLVFWLSLVGAGLIKAYWTARGLSFTEIMSKTEQSLQFLLPSGLVLALSLGYIAYCQLRAVLSPEPYMETIPLYNKVVLEETQK